MKRITALTLAFLIMLSMSGCTQSSYKPVVTPPPTNTVVLNDYATLYAEQGLIGAIRYFGEHSSEFSPEAKKVFAREVAYEVNRRGQSYALLNHAIVPVETPAPLLMDFVDVIYDGIYLRETNAVNLARISEPEALKAFAKIAVDDVFVFTKAYWVEDGLFQDAGFRVVVHPDLYPIIKECLELTFKRVEGTEDYLSNYGFLLPGIAALAKPTEIILEGDTAWDSKEMYPKVYLESFDQHSLLLDAWKTEVFLPVNFVKEYSLDVPKYQLSVLMNGEQLIAALGEGYTFERLDDGGYFRYMSTFTYAGISFNYSHDSELPATTSPPDRIIITSTQYRYDFDVLIGESALEALSHYAEHFENIVSMHSDEAVLDMFHYLEQGLYTGYILMVGFSTGERYYNISDIGASVTVNSIRLINGRILN